MDNPFCLKSSSQHVVFWQNFPNHLQAPLIQTLAEEPRLKVTLLCQEDIPARRRSLGWSEPDFGQANVVIHPNDEGLQKLLTQSDLRAVHIFSGTRGYPFVWRALQRVIHTDAIIGIYSETQDWRGVKGLLRLARAYTDALRLRSHIDFILAIGQMGVKWFRRCGYPDTIIYPFGYFVETPSGQPMPQLPELAIDSTFRLVAIGQCIHRKGIDLLLNALSTMHIGEWHLEVIGDGSERRNLEQLSCQLGIADQVRFLGALPNAVAMQHLEQSDLLVLPSRRDGWGAVVNEALMRGVPVVCSDHCGAADLLGTPERGAIFVSDSVEDLQAKLSYYIAQGRRCEESRKRLAEWAKAISGQSAAQYLMQILCALDTGAAKPSPPWLDDPEVRSN